MLTAAITLGVLDYISEFDRDADLEFLAAAARAAGVTADDDGADN